MQMLATEQKFKALTWKCDQLNISYGKLRAISSEEDIRKICQEYEKELAARRKRKKDEPAPQIKESTWPQNPSTAFFRKKENRK